MRHRQRQSRVELQDVPVAARASSDEIEPGAPIGRAFCVWITGLPAAGKTTVASELGDDLQRLGIASYILDGDQVREGLNCDLGFSATDRAESVRRVGEVARLMLDAGIVVIVSLISPYRKDRAAVRARFEAGCFIEVFLDTPAVCESRDPKGLYRRARVGELADFTGVSSAYERSHAPEIHLKHDGGSPQIHVARIVAYLEQHGLIATAGQSGIARRTVGLT